ncbi:hypothetical protein I2485_08635 [Nesterenkonia sp. E16_7]|nr:hypothetical protein [Nesterenkonia sp. E16_10]MBO0598719.1 hypothetical protein [Nesterenkonia sp. E16_7]
MAATPGAPALAQGSTLAEEGLVWEDDGIVTTVPGDPSNPATINIDGEMEIGLGVSASTVLGEGESTPEGTTVFPVEGSADAYALQVLDGGSISLSAVTTSPQSDHSSAYTLTPGVVPVVQDTGAVALYEDDVLVGIVEHPEAHDQNGDVVDSSYSVVEGELVQTVYPTADTAYPLVSTAAVGAFLTRGDYVHVTRGQASGHGWWVRGSSPALTAKVTVQLQYKPKQNSSWNNRGTAGVRVIKPGTAKRANARITCRSTASKQWRSWVDVDLIGYIDTPEKAYTGARTLRCTL